jgi:small subunit ribosomal protein S20
MPNTKSAERRMRSSSRKRMHNRMVKSRLHSLEKKYLSLLTTGNKPEATALLGQVSSAFDKAAKAGVLHKAAADRKKSRLSLRLNRVK